MSIGIIITIGMFLTMMLLAVPLGWLFIASTGIGLSVDGIPDNFLIGTFYSSLNSYVLMSIGFFVFAGSLISAGGLADKIVDFSHALVGKIRGGMTLVAIVSTVFMSALTGSSVPCVSALVPLLVPRLHKLGYKKEYTTAVLCSSSFLGYLIPPSVPALIYCLVAQQSVAAVFLSTVVPAILLAFGYAVLNYFIAPKYIDEVSGSEVEEVLSYSERVQHLKRVTWKALPALGCPLVILVGIYGGICTPNEAGAVAVIYSIIVGLFVYKHLNRKRFKIALLDTTISVGLIALLIASGSIISRYLVRAGAAQSLADHMLGLFESPEMILLSLNAFLLLLGMFIEAIPILILTVPLVLPLMIELDVNLVHLGAIFIINIGLGVITPPFAMSLFVGTRLSGTAYQAVAPIMMKYLFYVGIPVLMLTTYIPSLATWLPTLMLGGKVVGQ
ncbi:TRAP transporter large permease [Marinobacterium iners]|uniref:TRAP transporter large permease protein n=1 Tax=Marinobacterium iners DSM 11526 TaxID=1122198 RepID=A0A1H3X1Z9_9GAMM|nr:TRAP transporter large permease [Marinobacterium iners]SDZ93416.1 TRAP transporter, DctM subunit [Marinobacterium iners DSM 11526]